jgi:hypothetical protein
MLAVNTDPDDQASAEEEQPVASGCQGCLRWVTGLFLLLLLLALLWPVSKDAKQQTRTPKPPEFFVTASSLNLVEPDELSRLELKAGRAVYYLVDFELQNKEGKIASLSWDNFEMVVSGGYAGTRDSIIPHYSSDRLYDAAKSPWGKSLPRGGTVELKLLFLIPREAKAEAIRIYDADRRSNRYKDFPLRLGTRVEGEETETAKEPEPAEKAPKIENKER